MNPAPPVTRALGGMLRLPGGLPVLPDGARRRPILGPFGSARQPLSDDLTRDLSPGYQMYAHLRITFPDYIPHVGFPVAASGIIGVLTIFVFIC